MLRTGPGRGAAPRAAVNRENAAASRAITGGREKRRCGRRSSGAAASERAGRCGPARRRALMTRSLRLAACGLRLAACGLRLAACGLRLAACGLRLAACGLRLAACGLRLAACGLRLAACGLRLAACGVHCDQRTPPPCQELLRARRPGRSRQARRRVASSCAASCPCPLPLSPSRLVRPAVATAGDPAFCRSLADLHDCKLNQF